MLLKLIANITLIKTKWNALQLALETLLFHYFHMHLEMQKMFHLYQQEPQQLQKIYVISKNSLNWNQMTTNPRSRAKQYSI